MLVVMISCVLFGHNVLYEQGTGVYTTIEMTPNYLVGIIEDGGVDVFDRYSHNHIAVIPGNGPQAYGAVQIGNLLCVRYLYYLEVFDVAVAGTPRVGHLILTTDAIESWNNKLVAFLPTDEVVLYELTDPANPTPVTSVVLDRSYRKQFVKGDTLFLLDLYGGVAVADMNDLGHIVHHDLQVPLGFFTADVSRCFFSDGVSIVEYEVVNPDTVNLVATHNLTGSMDSMAVDGPFITISYRRHLYIYEGINGSFEQRGVVVFPVQNDHTSRTDFIRDHLIADGKSYVCCEDTGIRSVDLANASTLPKLKYRSPNKFKKVEIFDGYLVALQVSGTIDVLDITIPSDPSQVGSIVGFTVVDFVISSGLLFAATGSSIEVFELSNLSSPQRIGGVTSNVSVLMIDYPLLAGIDHEYPHSNEMFLFDVSMSSTPTYLSGIQIIEQTGSFTLKDGTVSIGRHLYDVSNPSTPVLAYSFLSPVQRIINDASLYEETSSIVCEYNVSDPYQPLLIEQGPRSYRILRLGRSVEANGLLYCVGNELGSIIIRDPVTRGFLAQHAIYEYGFDDIIFDIDVLGQTVVATTSDQDLIIFDVTQPAVAADNYLGDADVTLDLDVKGDKLVITKKSKGIEVYDILETGIGFKYAIPLFGSSGAQFTSDDEILVLKRNYAYFFSLANDNAEYLNKIGVNDFEGIDKVFFEVNGDQFFIEREGGMSSTTILQTHP